MLFGLVVVLASGCRTLGDEDSAKVGIGVKAPPFSLETLDGRLITNDDFDGRPLVLSFWATWCQPCLKEIPVLEELAKDARVEVIAVALDESGVESVNPFIRKHEIAYRVVLGDQNLFDLFNGFAIPYTLVLDSTHVVVNIYRGPAGLEALMADVDAMTLQKTG